MALEKQTLVPLGLSISSLLLEIGGFAYSSGVASAAQILASGSAIAERLQTLRDSHSLSDNITKQLVEHGKAYFSEVSLPNNEIKSCIADVCTVVKDLALDRESLFEAVRDKDLFSQLVHRQAACFRAEHPENAESFFDSLVRLVANEILSYAEQSNFFEVDALIELLSQLSGLRETIAKIDRRIGQIDATTIRLETKIDALLPHHLFSAPPGTDSPYSRVLSDKRTPLENEIPSSLLSPAYSSSQYASMTSTYETQTERPTTVSHDSSVKSATSWYPTSTTRPFCLGSPVRKAEPYIQRKEADDLIEQVFSSSGGFWSLHGMPCVGKSQIATALYKKAAADSFPLVIWHDASSRDQILAMYKMIAKALAPQWEKDDPQYLAQSVVNFLQNRHDLMPILFVLDNLKDADHLTNLLPTGDNIFVILTNTNAPPEGYTVISVSSFNENESMEFLERRIQNSSIQQRKELAKKLHHLPLALSHACFSIIDSKQSISVFLEEMDKNTLARSIPRHNGSLYPTSLSKALIDATSNVIHSFKKDEKECALKQLQALCLLSELGLPRDWLIPFGKRPTDAQRTLKVMADSSLLHITERDKIILQPLVARTIREHPDETLGTNSCLSTNPALHVLDHAFKMLKSTPSKTVNFIQSETEGFEEVFRQLLLQIERVEIQEHSSQLRVSKEYRKIKDLVLNFAQKNRLEVGEYIRFLHTTTNLDAACSARLGGSLTSDHKEAR